MLCKSNCSTTLATRPTGRPQRPYPHHHGPHVCSIFVLNSSTPQDKFEQLARELPQLVNVGCEVRVKGLGYTVQRAKGTADEPTVGDSAISLCKNLMCLPLIERLRKGKVTP